MKGHTALLFQVSILIMALLVSHGIAPSQAIVGMDVVINEFDSNPPIGPQWVEFHNPSDFPQDVTLWKMTSYSTGMEYLVPVVVIIGPKDYFVVNLPLPIIDPAGDVIRLTDKHGIEIDTTPTLGKPVKDDRSWSRVPNGIDTNTMLDWKLQSATKGSSNDVAAPPVVPTIMCTLSSSQLGIGSSVTIIVVIGPPRVAQVTVQAKKLEDATWSDLTTAATDSMGRYEYVWIPGTKGSYNVRAYARPSGTFPEMFSFPSFLSVTKIRMQLSCSITHPMVNVGQDLATFGYLLPAIEGISITLIYRKPTGSPIIKQVQTGSGGFFNDTKITPQEAGDWNVTASWEGDETHMTATSPLASFYVESPPFQFGMWLIIALVVSVSVSAVVLAAGLSTKAKPKPPRRVALCPQCRSVLLYVPSLRSWYCPRCRKPIP